MLIGLLVGLNWLLPALFHFFRKPLSVSLQLKCHSLRWPAWKRLYLLETKYKSGTIHADADAPQWQTICAQGINGSMRNALLQAKNTALVLEPEVRLPCLLVLIVVIHGRQIGRIANKRSSCRH